MKRYLLPVLFSVVVISMISCNKADSDGLLVPEDALFAMHMNNKSLTSKLSWSEIEQTNWFRGLGRTGDSIAAFSKPELSGVDNESNFVAYVKKNGRYGYFVMLGSLKDAAKFESHQKSMHSNAQVTKDGEYSYMTVSNESTLTWTKSHFALVSGFNMPNMANIQSQQYNTNEIPPADSIKAFGKYALTIPKGDRLGNNKKFASLLRSEGDIHIWMNTGDYYLSLMGPMLAMMGKLDVLLKDNVSTGVINFENGKMTFKSWQYYSKELSDVIAKYDSKNISKDALNRMPTDNLIAVGGINMHPQVIADIVKLTQLDGLIAMTLSQTGMSMEEIIKATNGEFYFAASNLKASIPDSLSIRNDSITMQRNMFNNDVKKNMNMDMMFAISVNDRTSFDKVMNRWMEGKAKMDSVEGGMTHKIANNWFAAGSVSLVDNFLSGKTSANGYTDKIAGHPMGMYVDLQKLFSSITTTDSASTEGLKSAAATWKEMISYGGEMKNGAMEFYGEVVMSDPNTNSLKQLNSFIDRMYVLFKDKDVFKQKDIEMQPRPDTLKAF